MLLPSELPGPLGPADWLRVSKFKRLTVSFDGWNHLIPLSAWAILWVVRLTVSLRSNTRWSSVSDLNQQPAHYKCAALPIEPTKQNARNNSGKKYGDETIESLQVEEEGFEPAAPCSQSTCATKLRYTSKN